MLIVLKKWLLKNEQKKALWSGFDIDYALYNSINSETDRILESLTDLSLAKAYFYSIGPKYTCFTYYYCTLQYKLRKVLMDREKGYKCLSKDVASLRISEETVPFYPFYKEWLSWYKSMQRK